MRALSCFAAAALCVPTPLQADTNIVLPHFDSAQLSGGGDVVVVPGQAQRVVLVQGSTQFTRFRVDRDGTLRIDTCDRQCPQHYDLKVRIEGPNVPDIAIEGGGVIRVAGGFVPQAQLSAAIDGGGKIDSRAVEAANVSAAVNGGGLIWVHPRRTLSAAVSGGGAIRYSGNPKVTSAIDGGGSINRGD